MVQSKNFSTFYLSLVYKYEVFIVEEENIRIELQSPSINQLETISSNVDKILGEDTQYKNPDIASGSFVAPDDLTAYEEGAEDITNVRKEFKEQEQNQENFGTVEIKVKQSIEFSVRSSTIPGHDDPAELKKWAEGKLEDLLRDLKLRSDLKNTKTKNDLCSNFEIRNSNQKSESDPEILIKISDKDGSVNPSPFVESAFKLSEDDEQLVIKAVFE